MACFAFVSTTAASKGSGLLCGCFHPLILPTMEDLEMNNVVYNYFLQWLFLAIGRGIIPLLDIVLFKRIVRIF